MLRTFLFGKKRQEQQGNGNDFEQEGWFSRFDPTYWEVNIFEGGHAEGTWTGDSWQSDSNDRLRIYTTPLRPEISFWDSYRPTKIRVGISDTISRWRIMSPSKFMTSPALISSYVSLTELDLIHPEGDSWRIYELFFENSSPFNVTSIEFYQPGN